MKRNALFTTIFILLSTLMPTVQAEDMRYIMSQRANWPKQVKLTADVDAPLFTSSGERVGSQAISKGRTLSIRGVYKQGIAIKLGKMIAFVPPGKTDIVSSIKETASVKESMSKPASASSVSVAAKPKKSVSAGMANLIDDNLIDASGNKRSRDELAGKYVGLYFSAKWCPPCRRFTPSLVDFRNANSDEFEVIFVSSDRDEAAQKDYMNGYNMKFLATPNGSESANTLSRKFGGGGIPRLVILDPQGNTVTTNGRGDVSRLGNDALSSWK